MRRKMVVICAAVLTATTILAGCGNGGSGGSDNGKTKIRFATWDVAEDVDKQQALVDKFNEEHDDIEVTLEAYGSDFDTKISAGMGSGDTPDVMYMWNYPSYYEGLEPLDDYIAEEGEDYKSNFYDTLWDYNTMDGSIYGIPVGFTTHCLFYNKDLFAQAGVEEPTADWTWDDLQAAAKTISEKTDAAGQRIVGLNTENAEINEGLVRFDIIFYVRMKNGLSQIIVNIEAQKDEPTEYKILNRAIFYVSRLISSQKERDFVNTNYDDIKQVFSIWICMNMDDNSLSHIHLTKDELLKPCNWKGNLDLLNIVLIGITNEIPKHDEKYEMHRLIGALLSSELKEQEKLDIIEHEYNIPISQEFREDVRIMCNLSTGIEERATEKTSEKFILNMYKKGYTLDQIADVAETGVDEVEAIIKRKEPAMA